MVVFPAPLAPSNPKIWPGRASKLIPFTAFTVPRFRSWKDLFTFSTVITISKISVGRRVIKKPFTETFCQNKWLFFRAFKIVVKKRIVSATY